MLTMSDKTKGGWLVSACAAALLAMLLAFAIYAMTRGTFA